MSNNNQQYVSITTTKGITLHKVGELKIQSGSLRSMSRVIKSWFDSENHVSRSIGFINPYVFNQAVSYPEVSHFISGCDLVCVDGIGISVGLRLFMGIQTTRVVATELFEYILTRSGIRARAIIIGVSVNEVQRAAEAMNMVSSGVIIVDAMDGYRNDKEYADIFRSYRDIDMVLIGAGSPRSECIGQLARRNCDSAISYHIGAGTIKIYAKTKRRAPTWVSQIGCEWLHRIIYEPHTRPRYFSGSLKYIRNLTSIATINKRKRKAL